MDFSDLKKQMEKLKETAKDLKSPADKEYAVDERIWKPTFDSAGNCSCVIRFLPQLDFSKPPYELKAGHYVKAGGKLFVSGCTEPEEKESCDVCKESNSNWPIYNACKDAHGKESRGCKAALEEVNKYKNNVQPVTNIQVIQNSLKPEEEGKVFIYKMPKFVFSKYIQKVSPTDKDDDPIIVYHPLEGRNFKLKATTKNKIPRYEESEFSDKTTPISPDEQIVMRVLHETHDLSKYMEGTKQKKEDINRRFAEFKKSISLSTMKEKEFKKEEPKSEINEEEVINDSLDDVEEVSIDEIDSLFD